MASKLVVNMCTFALCWAAAIPDMGDNYPASVHVYYPFTAYGGTYTVVSDGVLQGISSAINNPNIFVSALPSFADGIVSVEINTASGCGGLNLRVTSPAMGGADTFNGYGAFLCGPSLQFGRHAYNWTQLSLTAVPGYTMGTWTTLSVTMTGTTFAVRVNEELVITISDTMWASGGIALRSWLSNTQFRNLRVSTGGQLLQLDFFALVSEAEAPVSEAEAPVSEAVSVPPQDLNPEVLAAEATCYGASTALGFGYFTVPRSGVVTAVRLVHISGTLTNNKYASRSCSAYWGNICGIGDNLQVRVARATTPEVLWPVAELTRGYTGYFPPTGYSTLSDQMVFEGPRVVLRAGDQLRLAHSEALSQISEEDNDGVVCAKVYLTYDLCGAVSGYGVEAGVQYAGTVIQHLDSVDATTVSELCSNNVDCVGFNINGNQVELLSSTVSVHFASGWNVCVYSKNAPDCGQKQIQLQTDHDKVVQSCRSASMREWLLENHCQKDTTCGHWVCGDHVTAADLNSKC